MIQNKMVLHFFCWSV